MERSAGIAIIHENKILLGHPTGHDWEGTWGIPKGKIEPEEAPLNAAVRETLEEVGLVIPTDDVKEGGIIEYRSPAGKKYKTLTWFVYNLEKLSDIGLETLEISRDKLQLPEIDEARFMDLTEAKELGFWRQFPIYDTLLT